MSTKPECTQCGFTMTMMYFRENGELWYDYLLCECCGKVETVTQVPVQRR